MIKRYQLNLRGWNCNYKIIELWAVDHMDKGVDEIRVEAHLEIVQGLIPEASIRLLKA